MTPGDAIGRTVAVLRNPTAGRGRRRAEIDAALAELSQRHVVKLLEADSPQGALTACRQAVASGIDALVVVGGDGTVNLGLQAVATTNVGFGVLPAGTGNDFAHAIGAPERLVEAARVIADALSTGHSRPVDLVRLEGPDGHRAWFGAVFAAGFDALVNERANGMSWPKGRRRYDIAILLELMTLRARRYRVTLDDDQVVECKANLVAVANTPSYGGGMRMAPSADPTDGLLDVVIAGPVGRITLLRLFPKVFSGAHVGHPAVRTYRARTVRVEATGIVGYGDGERICPLPITATVEPAALRALI